MGDGTTKNTKAFADAIAACTQAGGGRVVVPTGGSYLTGAIHLDDNVNLHIEAGATIKFSDDPMPAPLTTAVNSVISPAS